MKKILIIFIGLFSLLSFNDLATADQEAKVAAEKIYYTAYNIWIPRWQSDYYTLNFKTTSNFLPAGTKVKNIKILGEEEDLFGEDSFDGEDDFQYIQFTDVKKNRTYKFQFYQPYHPKLSINDIKDRMFTTMPLEELLGGLEEGEIAAIKAGIVTDNMSRKAVQIAYGPAADHKTRGYESKRWTYYFTKKSRRFINFNSSGKTVNTGAAYIAVKAVDDANSIKKSLLNLKELKDQGVISEKEFENKKAELLKRI